MSVGRIERHEALVAIPPHSLGTPQDIANAVMFFAPDTADYITGQPVNGGAS
ncbi:hypothetical protein ACFQU1_09630 [Chelatococcus sp. GCM10030263]|uniref:hypothetical protein n=1 Tax=Chelatococcus sp. GCM10030263 TaxID=3273387 RepID=UPI00360DF8F6